MSRSRAFVNVLIEANGGQISAKRRLEQYQHPGGLRSEGAEYLGIHEVPRAGPANRGMPLIPIELQGDKIVGRLLDPEWYRYKKFKRSF